MVRGSTKALSGVELVDTNVDAPKGHISSHQIGQLFGLYYHKAQDKTLAEAKTFVVHKGIGVIGGFYVGYVRVKGALHL